MPKIKFEDPPKNVRRRGTRALIDAEVRAVRRRPNEWAKVREGASSGSYVTYKKRGCQVRTVSEGNGHYTIYIKWDPDAPEARAILREERKAKEAEAKETADA